MRKEHLLPLMLAVGSATAAASTATDDPFRKREADEMPVARGAIARRRSPGSVASRRRKLRRRGQR